MRKKNSVTIKKCKEIQRRGTIDPTLELLKTQLDSERDKQTDRKRENQRHLNATAENTFPLQALEA